MNTKTVFQTDPAGMFAGITEADESPLQPGVFLMPAGTVATAPPADWPEHQWPRWNGRDWQLVAKPKRAQPGLIEKLAAALSAAAAAFKQGGV